MQNSLFLAAALLYAVCALLPSRRGALISGVTAVAWAVHGAALGLDVAEPGRLRVGFAIMLSSALWVSVAAYWLENRNFALDGMRRLVMPFAVAASVLPVIFPGSLLPLSGQSPAFGWHVVVAVLAYSTVRLSRMKPIQMTRNSSFSMVSSAGNWSSALPSQPLAAVRVCSRASCSAISTAWKAAMVRVL